MAVAYRIDFEGGVVGDPVTASGNISAVVGTPVFTAESRGGLRAMRCTGLASTLIRTDWGANPITHTVSIDVKPKALSANAYFLRWGDTSNAIIASLRFGTTSNKFDLTDSGNTARATSASSWSVDGWYRLEADYDGTSPTAPIVTVRIYTVFGTAPAETISFTFATAVTMNRVQYGAIGTQASGSRDIVVDNIQVAYGIQRIGPMVEVLALTPGYGALVASPLRTWSPMSTWAHVAPVVAAVPPASPAVVTRTWSPLPPTPRAAPVLTFGPIQVAGRIERARPLGGWGIRGSLAQLIASTFSTSSVLTTSALQAVIDITGATVGHWVYLFVVLDAPQTAITLTGWMQVIEGDEAASTHYALYRRMKRAGDTTFTVSWPSSAKGAFGLVGYSGLDPSGPPDSGAAVALHTTGLPYPTPAVIPAKDTWWAATFTWSRTSTTGSKAIAFTPDSALTERLDVNNSAAAGSPWVGQQIADSNGPVSLASHSYTATQAFAEIHGGAILLYLMPAS